MSSYFLNFTTFDFQLWPPPPKIEPQVFADYALNPSVLVPLLLVYHTFTSIVLQAQNFRDYPGRRDSVWYQVCIGHMLVLELFMIRLLLIYQKHCSLSENIHLLVFVAISSLVNAVA